MSKILIGINTLTELDQVVYSNHLQFSFRCGRNNPTDDFILFTPRRMSIDMMRNLAAKMALEQECDYLMFVDDDVIVSPKAFQMLKKHDVDVVAGWTIIRGYPFNNMFFRYTDQEQKLNLTHWNNPPQENGLLEVDAVGFSCCLIKVDVLRKLTKPFFVTGPYNTEDIYFCVKAAREIGTQFYVDLDCKTGHKLNSFFVDPDNKKYFKILEESLDPEVGTDKTGDRGIDYLKGIGENIPEVKTIEFPGATW